MIDLEPHAYGSEFNAIEEVLKVVEDRKAKGLQLYGHAIVYIDKGKPPLERVGVRVGLNGDVMVGAHCEWI